MAAINCKIRTNNNAMSLRSDVSQAGRDAAPAGGTRLQHVLQVGANVIAAPQEDRVVVTVTAERSEMQQVLKTAIAESLEWIQGKGPYLGITRIVIQATDPGINFDITVFLSDGGSPLVQGVLHDLHLNNRMTHTSEEGILNEIETMLRISEGKNFKVRYQRKLGGE